MIESLKAQRLAARITGLSLLAVGVLGALGAYFAQRFSAAEFLFLFCVILALVSSVSAARYFYQSMHITRMIRAEEQQGHIPEAR